MYGIYDLFEGFGDLLIFLQGLGIIANIVLVAAMIAPYIFTGYLIMCIGKKAGVDDDWMPFLPISRQIYQMRIADCPWWYVLVFQGCFINGAIMSVILLVVGGLFRLPVVAILLMVIYWVTSLVFTFRYYKIYYPLFGFNPNTAWIEIIWSFAIVSTVLLVLLAFSDNVRYMGRGGTRTVESGNGGGTSGGRDSVGAVCEKNAVITGTVGKYAGASFDITDGSSIVFGRSATEANVIFDQFETDVSRKHCAIKYNPQSDQFIVTDFSTNGTYLEDGSRLTANQPISVMRGTVVYLGKNKKNAFKLG